jgi:hypothetical protein
MPRARILNRDDERHIDLRSTATKSDTVRLGKNLRQLHARGTHVPTPGKGAGVSVVKVRIMPSSRAGSYCAYMERDDKDAELLTAEGHALDKEAFIDRSRRDPHVFAVIVSPAGAKELNLECYTQRFMEQMEDDLGTKLDYTLAVHRDTKFHHAHVLILGHDDQGNDLYISRAYISHSMRARASEIAGRQQGLTDVWAEVSKWPGPDHIEKQIIARLELMDAYSQAFNIEREAISLSGGEPGGISEDEMRQYGWNPQHFRAAVRQFRSRLEVPPVPTLRPKAVPNTPPENYLTMKEAAERLGMRPGNFWSLARRQRWELLYFAERNPKVQRTGAKVLYIQREVIDAYLAAKANAPVRRTRGRRTASNDGRAQN